MLYTIQEYIMLFFFVSMFGWCMEVVLNIINEHKFVNRGFLIGPYCPIYGTGTVLITFFLSKYRGDIIVLFIMSTIICSLLEYFASYFMEKLFNARWWDYSKYKYNLNGRICLSNSLLFGLGGTIVIVFLVPTLMKILGLININVQNILVNILLFIYLIDNIVSFCIIIRLRNLEVKKNDDNTEEITLLIKKKIVNSIFIKRIKKAYPAIQKKFDSFLDDVNEKINKISDKLEDMDIIKKNK